MKALKILSELDYQHKREKFRTVPEHAITRTRFSDKTSAGLTQCILRWLTLHGHYGVRINTMGRKLKDTVIVDVIGRSRTLPGKWVPGTTHRGTADIHAVISGKHISIEIKVGRDIVSPHQHKTKDAIEKCGGTYLIIHSLEEFYAWYCANVSKQKQA
jgi:hypothetical protein